MVNISYELRKLQISKNLDERFYRQEANKILKKYNQADRNFKYFIQELVEKTKDTVEIDALRDIVSMLQRCICVRINNEQDSDEEIDYMEYKIKNTKTKQCKNKFTNRGN